MSRTNQNTILSIHLSQCLDSDPRGDTSSRPVAKTLREVSSPGQKRVVHGGRGRMRAQQSFTLKLYYPCAMASVLKAAGFNRSNRYQFKLNGNTLGCEPGLYRDRFGSIASKNGITCLAVSFLVLWHFIIDSIRVTRLHIGLLVCDTTVSVGWSVEWYDRVESVSQGRKAVINSATERQTYQGLQRWRNPHRTLS
jgi:hypothetical protein